jgi:hypothetical protein
VLRTLDAGPIRAARADAALRCSQATAVAEAEDPQSPYYIELNLCGGE